MAGNEKSGKSNERKKTCEIGAELYIEHDAVLGMPVDIITLP
jgi:hypothetical protein